MACFLLRGLLRARRLVRPQLKQLEQSLLSTSQLKQTC
jgi:hypothetical protein